MPDIMQMVQQQLARLNQNLQRQVQQVTSGYQQGFNASSGGPSGPAMGGMGISQAQFQAQQSSQQISQSAMPSPGGGSGAAGGGGLGSRIPGGMKSAYGLMGGHLGMGIMAASMILPAMMQGGASGRNQETQITELEKSAHRASSAIARLNLNLRMTAAATGTSAGGVISTASMYSAVGVEDSLGMAQNMAAQHAAYTGQMAMGTPEHGSHDRVCHARHGPDGAHEEPARGHAEHGHRPSAGNVPGPARWTPDQGRSDGYRDVTG